MFIYEIHFERKCISRKYYAIAVYVVELVFYGPSTLFMVISSAVS